jgi:WD40 repeat protein
VTALAFFPENDMLISGAENGEVLLWDLKMGKLLARNAVAHSDAVTGLDVCLPAVGGGGGGGGGTLFASASLDCTVKVWDSSSVADPSESVVSPVTGDTPGNEFRPVKEFRTRDTPLQTLRFGLTNVIYTAGAPRVDD